MKKTFESTQTAVRTPLKLAAAAAAALLILSGCAVGPNYTRPSAVSQMPAQFKEAPAGWKSATPNDAALKGDWWTMYGDPVLNSLESQVEINNQNVAQYAQKYLQAVALVAQSDAALYPSITAGASGSRGRTAGVTKNTFSFQGNFSWEPDLWGKLRRARTADEASAEASAADLANARLSAQASLAEDYFTLRVLDRRIAVYGETIKVYQKNVETLRNQYESGQIAKSDLTSAEQSLYSAEASRDALKSSRAQYEHAIAVLIGKAPAEFTLLPQDTALPSVPAIPAAIPSTLLERRPDIASAERAVAAANEKIGIAIAGYYPDITLSGSGGWSGGHFSQLISADHLLWSLGASAAQTIFDAGSTRAKVAQARAAYEQSVTAYRQTVLEAFQTTEDALSSQASLASQVANTRKSLSAATETASILMNRYKAGMIDYTNVSSSEATRLSSEQSLLSLQSQELVNSVELIKALGGGWKGLDPSHKTVNP